MKVAVVGTGYVGLVTGVVLASLGNEVICVDRDRSKLDPIERGESPIFEPGLTELLQRTRREGLLTTSESVVEATRQSEIVFIAVGTPPRPDGSPDLTAVRMVAAEIAKGIEKYTVVVNKSTVPVGCASIVEEVIAELGISSMLYDVVSNPEFLREGSAVHDTLTPDRLVIGASSERAASRLIELYKPLGRNPIVTDPNTAELIKYASNSFLALKISYMNAIACLCEMCGADAGTVSIGMGSDNRIGHPFLKAGLGWGGSCFPKDLKGLISIAEGYGYDFKLLKEVVAINDAQVERLIGRVEQRLGTLEGKTIALLGLAFKPNTDDIRDARSLLLIEKIEAAGGKVRACDPVTAERVATIYPSITVWPTPYETSKGADAAILVTEWDEFKSLDLKRLAKGMSQPILFDGRRIYDPTRAADAGIEYYAVGNADERTIKLPTPNSRVKR
jgi:UDPglucose 6-dehydrogenase